MFDLSAKSVLVTGAGKGIGLGIAQVFARAGANVAVAARSPHIESVASELNAMGPGKVIGVRMDVADRRSCVSAVEAVLGAYDGLDVVCANAGIFPEAALHTMTDEQLSEVLDVNVKGTVYTVQACLDALTSSGGGRVIITSSITGPVTGYPGWSHYGASKAAQLGFMRTAAIELAPRRVTVNAILPGNILTDGLAGMGQDYLSAMARAIPLGALGTPADIGHLAAFLATDEAAYITGQAIVVDGGQVLPETPEAIVR